MTIKMEPKFKRAIDWKMKTRMECPDLANVNTGGFAISSLVMSYCQLHFISTLQITGYPVRLSFNRQNIANFENSTGTSSFCFRIDDKNLRVVNTSGINIFMRIYDHDIRKAVDSIKLHLVPQVSVPGAFSVWICIQITIYSTLCMSIFTRGAALRHGHGFDWECSWGNQVIR